MSRRKVFSYLFSGPGVATRPPQAVDRGKVLRDVQQAERHLHRNRPLAPRWELIEEDPPYAIVAIAEPVVPRGAGKGLGHFEEVAVEGRDNFLPCLLGREKRRRAWRPLRE